MKSMGESKITLENVGKFIRGNYEYYKAQLFGQPLHIQEQIEYRMSKCADDCIVTGKCKECGCPVEKKVFNDFQT